MPFPLLLAATLGTSALSAASGAMASSASAKASKQAAALQAQAERERAAAIASGSQKVENAYRQGALIQVPAIQQATAQAAGGYDQAISTMQPSLGVAQGALGLYATALGLPGYALQQYGAPGSPRTTPGTVAVPGTPDWNAYIQGNHDVQAIQDIMDGKIQGDEGQLNFLRGYQENGAPNGESLGEYHYRVAGRQFGRQLPTTGGVAGVAPTEIAQPGDYQAANQGALQQLFGAGGLDIPSIVKGTPGYQGALDTGLKAVQGAKAAGGSLRSGGTLKALQDRGEDIFGGYYDKWMAGVGGLGAAAPGIEANIGNMQVGKAGALASGTLGIANAQSGALVNGANAWLNGATAAAGANVNAAGAQGQGLVNAAQAWGEGLGGIAGSASGALQNYMMMRGMGGMGSATSGGWMAGDANSGLGAWITPAMGVG